MRSPLVPENPHAGAMLIFFPWRSLMEGKYHNIHQKIPEYTITIPKLSWDEHHGIHHLQRLPQVSTWQDATHPLWEPWVKLRTPRTCWISWAPGPSFFWHHSHGMTWIHILYPPHSHTHTHTQSLGLSLKLTYWGIRTHLTPPKQAGPKWSLIGGNTTSWELPQVILGPRSNTSRFPKVVGVPPNHPSHGWPFYHWNLWVLIRDRDSLWLKNAWKTAGSERLTDAGEPSATTSLDVGCYLGDP